MYNPSVNRCDDERSEKYSKTLMSLLGYVRLKIILYAISNILHFSIIFTSHSCNINLLCYLILICSVCYTERLLYSKKKYHLLLYHILITSFVVISYIVIPSEKIICCFIDH